jgi:threonine/homoserine/homoserine lactone efflux protein
MFPIDPAVYTAYLGTVFLLAVTPGTDNIYVLTRTLSQGRTAGFLAAGGIALALVVHVTAITLGLSQLFLAAPKLYAAVKYAGVAYLLYLAYKAFTTEESPISLKTSNGGLPKFKIIRQAALLCLLNPKLAVFFIAFLPQFTDPNRADMVVQLFTLGLTFAIIGLGVFCLAIVCVAPVGKALQSSPLFWKWQGRVSGSVLGAMAVWLVAAED